MRGVCVCVSNAVSSLCGSNLWEFVFGRGRSFRTVVVGSSLRSLPPCVLASARYADAVKSRAATYINAQTNS